MTHQELNRAATQAGVNKESFGENMNLARRFLRVGKKEEASQCALKAIKLHADWPHLFSHINDKTLNIAKEMI